MLQHAFARTTALSLIAFLMLFAVACGGSSDVPDEQVTDTQAQTQESKTVVLYQYRYNPTALTVSQGTNVVFQNRDPEPHNVNIPALNVDQNIEPNQEWSFTFDTLGEFAVGSRFNDTMKLDVVVQ